MRRIREFAIHRRGLLSRVMAIVFLLAMFVGLLSLTAFAQTTYVITDGTRVLVYTSNATGKKVYDVLPLDMEIEDWKTQMNLSDSTLKEAHASYERTMAIVGEGLAEIQEYLNTLPEIE